MHGASLERLNNLTTNAIKRTLLSNSGLSISGERSIEANQSSTKANTDDGRCNASQGWLHVCVLATRGRLSTQARDARTNLPSTYAIATLLVALQC